MLPWSGEMLQPDDIVLALNGTPVASYSELGKLANQHAAPHPLGRMDGGAERRPLSFTGPHPAPAMVGGVQVKSAAMDAGLQPGDIILRADGRNIVTFMDLREIVTGSDGKPVALTVWRDGSTTEMTLTPRKRDIPQEDGGFRTEWLMGIEQGWIFDPGTRPAGLAELLTGSLSAMWGITANTFSGLWHMIVGNISSCNMTGVIGMADALGDAAKAGPQTFFTLFAIISFGVGILNLFPIPVLDGGHLVFHAYEAVSGRLPSDWALRVLMSIGLTVLLSVMVFALLQDVTCV